MSNYGHGPGPYLFGGPEGLERAIAAYEASTAAPPPPPQKDEIPRIEGLARLRGSGDAPEEVLYGPQAHD